MPGIPNPDFAITCGNAPASGSGLLALSAAGLTVPIVPVGGPDVWVDPSIAVRGRAGAERRVTRTMDPR